MALRPAECDSGLPVVIDGRGLNRDAVLNFHESERATGCRFFVWSADILSACFEDILHESGGAVFQPPSLGGWKAAVPALLALCKV